MAEFQVGILTDEEHELVEMLGQCANRFAKVIGHGPTSSHDYGEVVDKIHQLQSMVLSQAAARWFPSRYRLLGETLAERASPEGNREWLTKRQSVR